jgi:hypothetical protein
MSIIDALAVLAADEAVLRMQMADDADVAELQRAAHAVVDAHAEALAERYTRTPPAPFLKLISN